jgi:hypothetical protein
VNSTKFVRLENEFGRDSNGILLKYKNLSENKLLKLCGRTEREELEINK